MRKNKHSYQKLKNSKKLRESIWKDVNLSGSKFKNWIMDPDNFLKNENVEFDEFVKEKVEIGNKIENFIFDLAKEKLGNSFKFIKEKATFESLEYKKMLYANVDGFCENNGETYILEIKNTEIDDIDVMVDNYYYQLLYYCWFFNTKKALFVNFVKGWKLRYKIVEFTDQELENAENYIIEFANFKALGKTIKRNKPKKIISDIDNAIKTILELNELVNKQKRKLELAKKQVKDYLENKELEKFQKDNFIATFQNRTISSFDFDIFKNHLEIKLKEWGIDATDLINETIESSYKSKNSKVLKIITNGGNYD